MIKLGDYNVMTVARQSEQGLYMDGGPVGDLLLPARYVPEGTQIGDQLEVFVYLDQEERPVCTTQRPLARVGDFAYLQVAWVNKYGAFLRWGLLKDLFCPFREQKMRMEQGKGYIVHVHIDEESYRIMASAKIEKWLDDQPEDLVEGQEVDLLVWQKTELGFKVIVNNRYAGLVYDRQVFKPVHTGDRMKGYVAQVRPDGKLDIALQPSGRRQTEGFAATLLEWLAAHDGYCPLGDKSDAQDISAMFQVSKKTFKRAVGDLYKRRLVEIGDTEVRLIAED